MAAMTDPEQLEPDRGGEGGGHDLNRPGRCLRGRPRPRTLTEAPVAALQAVAVPREMQRRRQRGPDLVAELREDVDHPAVVEPEHLRNVIKGEAARLVGNETGQVALRHSGRIQQFRNETAEARGRRGRRADARSSQRAPHCVPARHGGEAGSSRPESGTVRRLGEGDALRGQEEGRFPRRATRGRRPRRLRLRRCRCRGDFGNRSCSWRCRTTR